VDGFRIDVLSLLVEDDQLRDNPLNPNFREGDWPYLRQHFRYTHDQPETRELPRRIRKVADEYGDDKVLLAELVVRSRPSPPTTTPTATGSRSR
jgi:alpha-glucosidase